jgi:nucleoside-diphosphate-sugar epimerase
MEREQILVIGANGQVGTALVTTLRGKYGSSTVLAADIQSPWKCPCPEYFLCLDILDKTRLEKVVSEKNVKEVYLLAAMLSATGEEKPLAAWDLNMQGLLNILQLAVTYRFKVFWPSSIAVFGEASPKTGCGQEAATDPRTVYGLSKLAGEWWCRYYYEKWGVDVRSVRYPGLIGYDATPGGGTTDYAVSIFHEALQKGSYNCFLHENTRLPMMYMPDAIRATIEVMLAPKEKISVRTSYNIAAMSFSPADLFAAIEKRIPGFRIQYRPDYRQKIANTWPGGIDDRVARMDWGWKAEYDLEKMTEDMLSHLAAKELLEK